VLPEPPAFDRELEAGAVFGRATLCIEQDGSMISSIQTRPPCTGSSALAISIKFGWAAARSLMERHRNRVHHLIFVRLPR
jgi:hypothetical protein